jgi:hypothetical protein
MKQAEPALKKTAAQNEAQTGLHPAWQAMIRLCREMGYGEISGIKIHDGIPVAAEVVTKKIRWS